MSDTDLRPRTQTTPKLARPKPWRVLLHNDDYTPRFFVVLLLEQIFRLDEVEATRRMLHAHRTGLVVAGVYPHELAETKVEAVLSRAREAGFPLLCTMEPEEGPDDAS